MSRDQINRLLEDITKDPSEWQRDKSAVMGRYDLTPEERDAITTGDEASLRAVGVEERLNKNLQSSLARAHQVRIALRPREDGALSGVQ